MAITDVKKTLQHKKRTHFFVRCYFLALVIFVGFRFPCYLYNLVRHCIVFITAREQDVTFSVVAFVDTLDCAPVNFCQIAVRMCQFVILKVLTFSGYNTIEKENHS